MKKTVLITGASGNMGQAMVRKFLAMDYNVAGTILPNDPVRMDIVDSRFSVIEWNVADEALATEKFAEIMALYGTIDAAVLTVGGFTMGDMEKTTATDISKQVELNFLTAFNVARPVYLQMKKQGKGRIFLVGSGPGMDMKKSKGTVAYAISKSLVFRLAELINAEAEGTDVVVQVIVPSTIDTPQNRKSMPSADFSKWVKPETIAERTFDAIDNISPERLLLF